ncbi:MAG: molybdenum ABC transporter ATP-binding protein [Woeseiaceae bacterium]
MRADAAERLSLDVSLELGEFRLAVRQDLELQGITGLFGASGAGKSTLLRIIAGLERRAAGRVCFGEDCWQDSAGRSFIAAHRRPLGYVFQDARLFEHLSVEGNLQFAARRAGSSGTPIAYREIVGTFDLEALLGRRIGALSGGERQRVAIARTLMTQPRLLLLDEPLAGLDAKRKSEILPYLEALPARFGIPAIHVSHAVEEFARLARHVVVLDRGCVLAAGSTARVLNRPGLQRPHSAADTIAVLEARVVEQLEDLHLTRLEHGGQAFVVPRLGRSGVGDTVRLNVRAGDVAVATEKPASLSFRNVLAGTLVALSEKPDSAFAIATIDIGGATLLSQLTRHAVRELGLEIGMPVFALLKTASFDRT